MDDEKKIEAAASELATAYGDNDSHPRHWECCYSYFDTEKHFETGFMAAIKWRDSNPSPSVEALVKALEEIASKRGKGLYNFSSALGEFDICTAIASKALAEFRGEK